MISQFFFFDHRCLFHSYRGKLGGAHEVRFKVCFAKGVLGDEQAFLLSVYWKHCASVSTPAKRPSLNSSPRSSEQSSVGAAGQPPGGFPGSGKGQADVASPAAHSWSSCWAANLESGTPDPDVATPRRDAGAPLLPPLHPGGSGAQRPKRASGCRGLAPGGREAAGRATWGRAAAAAWGAPAPPVGVSCSRRRHLLHGQRHCGAFLRCFRAVAEAQPPERALTTPRSPAASPQPLARAGSTPIVRASRQTGAAAGHPRPAPGPPAPRAGRDVKTGPGGARRTGEEDQSGAPADRPREAGPAGAEPAESRPAARPSRRRPAPPRPGGGGPWPAP